VALLGHRSIDSSGPFELTITTLEKGFNFQLKQPITEASTTNCGFNRKKERENSIMKEADCNHDSRGGPDVRGAA